MKIIMMTIVSAACFVGYIIVFGMAFGVSPSQMTHAFGSQQTGAHSPQDAQADSTAIGDSTALASQDAETDSLAKSNEINASIVQDSLKLTLAKINKEKAELEKLRTEVNTLLKVKSHADSIQISNLAKMYDGVEPAQLAQVMSNMDDSLIIAILPRLKAQKAGKILERMPADRAARISSKLLGYN